MIELPTVSPNVNLCGECRACCVTPAIPWLDKPEKVPCSHLCDSGCGIHASKPADCAAYLCVWRQMVADFDRNADRVKIDDYNAAQVFRPDRCGVIFQFLDDFLGHLNAVVLIETREHGARSPGVEHFAKILCEGHQGVLLVTRHDGEKSLMVPFFEGSEEVASKLRVRIVELGGSGAFREVHGIERGRR